MQTNTTYYAAMRQGRTHVKSFGRRAYEPRPALPRKGQSAKPSRQAHPESFGWILVVCLFAAGVAAGGLALSGGLAI